MSKKFTETLIMQFDPRALCKRDELKQKKAKKKQKKNNNNKKQNKTKKNKTKKDNNILSRSRQNSWMSEKK